jgi:hypothetical protein
MIDLIIQDELKSCNYTSKSKNSFAMKCLSRNLSHVNGKACLWTGAVIFLCMFVILIGTQADLLIQYLFVHVGDPDRNSVQFAVHLQLLKRKK